MVCKVRYHFIIILVLLLTVALSSVAFGEEAVKGVVVANDVNIRNESNIDSSIVGNLKLGQYLTILDSSDEWFNIESDDGLIGWVYSDLIVPINQETARINRGIINSENVNVREQSSLESHILFQLQKDNEVNVVEELINWYKVSLEDGSTGWVHREFLEIKPKYSRGQITGSSVNLRLTPSELGDIALQLDINSTVAIKNYKDGWYNVITSEDSEGWIHQNYVTVIIDLKGNFPEISRFSTSRSTSQLKIIEFAKKFLGTPYKYASNGPNSFDCSGYTTYIFKQFGITLPRTSRDQAKSGEKVTKDNLTMGDLVFFDTSGVNDGNVSHVGIYIGSGEFIHASSGSNAKKVTISNLDEGYYKEKYVTSRRVL